MATPPVLIPTAADEKEFRDASRAQWVDDVASQVADLPAEGLKLAIYSDGDVFPSKFRYTRHKANDGGAQNHFQGCARLVKRPFFVVSGGDWREQSSHLFVAKLASRGQRARWESNLEGGKPPPEDRAVQRVDLDELMWHAGGVDVCGHLLAVPVECGGKAPGARPREKCGTERSRILFFDLRNPFAPLRLDHHIDRPNRKATAVGLVHLPNLGYVAAILSGAKQDKTHHGKQIEFYESAEDRIGSQFTLKHTYHVPNAVRFDDYQSVNLVYQSTGDLYLLGMTGRSVDLFWVPFPELNTPSPSHPALEFLARREFTTDRNLAEFKAGAGIYAADGAIRLYAVPQWRLGDGRLPFTEWSA